MTFQRLALKTEGRIATVSLNRPDVRNAFDPVMIGELKQAFDQLGARADLSVIVLRGEGKSFSSGADLGYMKAMASFSFEENEKDARTLDAMFWSLRSCALPIVGRLHGHAMGGALGLTALCDVAAAVEGTQFAFSEVRLGLAPAVISPYVLEKMSASHAKRFMLTGEVFDAHQAREAGLVEFVGSEALVDSFVKMTATAIASSGPEAVRATKKLLRELEQTSHWDLKRDLTTKTIAERRVSEEGQEGLRGFLEKRTPKWKT
ncbi:MAG: enoyl-CoA hydratase-related protein [Bdellovibrionota bacterium]